MEKPELDSKNRSDTKPPRKYRVCLIPACTVSPDNTKENRVQGEERGRKRMRAWDPNRQRTHSMRAHTLRAVS